MLIGRLFLGSRRVGGVHLVDVAILVVPDFQGARRVLGAGRAATFDPEQAALSELGTDEFGPLFPARLGAQVDTAAVRVEALLDRQRTHLRLAALCPAQSADDVSWLRPLNQEPQTCEQ